MNGLGLNVCLAASSSLLADVWGLSPVRRGLKRANGRLKGQNLDLTKTEETTDEAEVTRHQIIAARQK